jgi:predicted RNase H-like HicB family nuclease
MRTGCSLFPALLFKDAQGDSYEQALENLKDAIKLHIEVRQSLGEPIPIEIAIDRVETNA